MSNEVTWDPAEAAGLSAADYELYGPEGAATLQKMQNLYDPRADLYGVDNIPVEEPQKAPEAASALEGTNTPEEQKEPAQELTEASEDASGFLESDFRKEMVTQLGSDEAFDSIMTTVEGAGDEVVKAFLDSAVSEDTSYAQEVTEWAKHAQDAGASVTEGVTVSAFSESEAADISSASEYGADLVGLNRQLVAGEISKTQLIKHVATNPALLREAVRLRNMNLLTF